MSQIKIAIAGAGIYGSTIATRLARRGAKVDLYDPLGIMRSASAINQFRVHKGYHYPRSISTITEILESRQSFIKEYESAIFKATGHYYAIPHQDSLTSPQQYEEIFKEFDTPLRTVRPDWINFDFIQACYEVDECLYDAQIMTRIIEERIQKLAITFHNKAFTKENEREYDHIIYATYGASGSHMQLFDKVELQIAEKILIRLPDEIQGYSLVVVDGLFTAFDPYCGSKFSQFGSALHTNHWKSDDPEAPLPKQYVPLINAPEFQKVELTHFHHMVEEAQLAVPLCAKAEYLGSRFTLRLVEGDKKTDRRILKIGQQSQNVFHVFSGKVVGACKAAKILEAKIYGS